MSHSLSLDVMEMAEVAALLERLAAGLEAAPTASPPLSSSACSERTEPCVRTCCCSLQGTGTHTASPPGPPPPGGPPPPAAPRFPLTLLRGTPPPDAACAHLRLTPVSPVWRLCLRGWVPTPGPAGVGGAVRLPSAACPQTGPHPRGRQLPAASPGRRFPSSRPLHLPSPSMKRGCG